MLRWKFIQEAYHRALQTELMARTKNGAGERSRTLDLLITSQLLYQLSYTGSLRKNIYLLLFIGTCRPNLRRTFQAAARLVR